MPPHGGGSPLPPPSPLDQDVGSGPSLHPRKTETPGIIRMGDYFVVQNQKALGSGGYGQALEVEHVTGPLFGKLRLERFVLKLFHNAEECGAEVAAYTAIEKAVKELRLVGKQDAGAAAFFRILDLWTMPPLAWLVLPLVPSGDLWAQLKKRQFGREEVATILCKARAALQFLHDTAGVLHLDIKPQNMLWTADRLILIDFSLWEQWPVPAEQELRDTYCSRGFRAPELDHSWPKSQTELHCLVVPAIDWWSLGCVGGCLAWAMNVPGKRPEISTNDWNDSAVRKQHLNRVAQVGTTLRRVLDMLLHDMPLSRSPPKGAGLFDAMMKQMQDRGRAISSGTAGSSSAQATLKRLRDPAT